MPPVTPKFNIKRVKLLIRRPPPNLSNPRQRAPASKHNSSLSAFLNSYITLNDEDVDEKTLQQEVATDAAVFERAEVFRKQGLLIPGTDMIFDLNDFDEKSSYPSPQRVTKDRWDNVVEAAIECCKSRSKHSPGQQIAGQIAAKVRTYWEGQEAKKDKLRQQEERRLRVLAKATIRMVTNEWKKAVFVSCR